MSTSDFTTSILVDQSPEAAFNAINNVRGWWSEEIEGSTDTLNEVLIIIMRSPSLQNPINSTRSRQKSSLAGA